MPARECQMHSFHKSEECFPAAAKSTENKNGMTVAMPHRKRFDSVLSERIPWKEF